MKLCNYIRSVNVLRHLYSLYSVRYFRNKYACLHVGDTGIGIQEWVNTALGVQQLTFPHLRLLFPTAPPR